jgi:uncharacterized protein (TIGR00288 family)
MTTDRVMLLIDADNLSLDVIDQAVRLLLNQHGGLHVRRAYCTAESAVANQAAFKRLGIKPMVNLAAGKNSTDIAMAVDAIDLVLAERPDVVVIASSDSDFAPLVQRLREKGCVVRGIGQQGKTGDETQSVYDDFTVLEHRKAESDAQAKPARKTAARKSAARKTTVKAAAPKTAAKKAPAARKAAAPAEAPPRAARKAAPRKTATVAAVVTPVPVPAPAPTAVATPSPAPLELRRGATSVNAVLACLPELAAGQSLALNVAVQRLREAQLLGKNSSSLKLFAQWSDRFDLLPADKPTQVRLR